ncbi:MAG: hypothetical protein HYV37_02470 [Candidatus Levyibacteriota bacterium]|nr:MAG: hypothetical protein HYV37_02470 [Candidatus Levybacteria bacterium]
MEGAITPKALLYTRFAREERKLPPLIEDARQNPLVKAETADGTVYVKDVAILTARQHMLVIPDQPSGVIMGSVQEVPLPLLGDTFQAAGDIAKYYESQPGIEQVDMMINFSTDPLKRIQTQPNLHVHILGYGPDDIQKPTNRREMRANPELRPQESEPLNSVIYDLLDQQVFPSVATDPAFKQLFERTTDEHGAITYRLIYGDATFSDSDFPRVMQEIHKRSQEVYNQLASVYFEMDKDGRFVEEVDGRNKLLSQEKRINNVAIYISEHPSLSSTSQRWLQFLANHATDLETVIVSKEQAKGSELSPQERKHVINRFAAIKDLSYGLTFSGIKIDDKYDWRMGYDPIVFSTRGTLAASRGIPKAGIMDSTMIYDPQTLEIVKASERKLGEYLVEKGKQDSSLPYQPGPQLYSESINPG